MNLDRSNLRSTPYKANIQLQSEFMDTNLLKSYMFHMATKGKHAKKDIANQVEHFDQHMRNSHLNKKKKPIFKSVLKSEMKINKYKLLMSNLAEKANNFSCCNPVDARQPVVVYLSQYKQMTIKNVKQTENLYTLNFNTIQVRVDLIEIETSAFVLNVADNKVMLKFENSDDEDKNTVQILKKNLDTMIRESMGFQYHMQDLKQKQGFENRRYKPCVQFAQHCQTGDILLFQGQQFFAKLQRFITGSQYDHVGMVYKDPIHGILIFESNSFNGICLSPWQYVVKYKWYTFIQRIVWRKLVGVERTNQFIERVQDIIMQKLGKAYHISFDKLWSNNSYIYASSSKKNQKEPSTIEATMTKSQIINSVEAKKIGEKEDKTKNNKQEGQKKQSEGYFCSELVAKVYKQLKLISTDEKYQYYKPSCNYYPLHFTQRFDLHLLKGELSDQYILHFQSDQIADYYNFCD